VRNVNTSRLWHYVRVVSSADTDVSEGKAASETQDRSWGEYIPPKRGYLLTKLHGVTTERP
jgi:hypothetical protein